MRDLTEFEKLQAVGTRIAEASVTKTAELLGFSRATISRTITDFKKHGQISINRINSGRTFKQRPKCIKTYCRKKASDYYRQSDY